MKTASRSLFFLFFCCITVALTGTPETTDPFDYLSIEGRYGNDGNALIVGFPGVTFSASFTGSEFIELDAVLESGSEAFFNAYLNGIDIGSVRVGKERKVSSIANRLDPQKTYSLKLIRRNEAWQGVVRVYGIKGGKKLNWKEKPAKPIRKLMFIGDSITCGANSNIPQPFSKATHLISNAEKSYGYILGEKLGASVHLISYGGKGLIRDWQGLTTEVTAPQFFERTLPDNEFPSWNHETFQPDCVSICLGTNDFNQGLIEAAAYTTAYVAFCERIRSVHPDAHILLVSSPMHGIEDEKRNHLETCIQKTISHLKNKGFDKISWHSTTHKNGCSFDSHPTISQHIELAEELYPVIGKSLNWLE